MSFAKAAKKAPAAVAAAVQPGKQALEKAHRKQVDCVRPAALTASVELDEATRPAHPQAPRWDYGLGYTTPGNKEVAIWVEVHSATTSQVGKMLDKLEWLKRFLREECDDLWKLTLAAERPYYWVASGGIAIPPNSPQARRLSISALRQPTSMLKLP